MTWTLIVISPFALNKWQQRRKSIPIDYILIPNIPLLWSEMTGELKAWMCWLGFPALSALTYSLNISTLFWCHRGSLLSLKLSPNLRVLPKDTRGIFLEGDVRIKWEINKMIRILNLVRDPSVVVNPKPDEVPLLTNLADIPGQLSRIES